MDSNPLWTLVQRSGLLWNKQWNLERGFFVVDLLCTGRIAIRGNEIRAMPKTPAPIPPSHMPLPAELIDHIFSFLRGDIPALRACSTHPFLSQIAERYLYADIAVTLDTMLDSALYERLSKNPHLLHYPRTLEIQANSILVPDLLLMSIVTMIPRMVNLTSLKLCETQAYFNRSFLSILFENWLRKSSVEQVYLSRLSDFPLSVLNNVQNIKKLTFSGCSLTGEPMTEPPHQPLQVKTLVIRGYCDARLLAQLTGRVSNLISLNLPDAMGLRQWKIIPELVIACSKSLTTLRLNVHNSMQSLSSMFLEFTSASRTIKYLPSGLRWWQVTLYCGSSLSANNKKQVGGTGSTPIRNFLSHSSHMSA